MCTVHTVHLFRSQLVASWPSLFLKNPWVYARGTAATMTVGWRRVMWWWGGDIIEIHRVCGVRDGEAEQRAWFCMQQRLAYSAILSMTFYFSLVKFYA